MRYAILALALVGCGSSQSKDIAAEPRDLKVRWSDGTSTAISLYTVDLDGKPHLKMVYGDATDSVRGDVVWEKPYLIEDAPVIDEPLPEELGND